MRKIIVLTVLVAALFAGCSKDLSKQQYYEKGVKLLKGGNSNGAIVVLKKAIEKDQNYFEARYQLGLAYIGQGKYEAAERELMKVLRLNPSFDTAHIALARVYTYSSKTEDAVKEINLYLSKVSDNPEAYEVAAAVYSAKKDYAKAEELLFKALKISPDSVSSKVVLADVYFADNKIDHAESLLKEALNSDSKNKRALYSLARIKQKQGKTDDVIDTYQKLVGMYPADVNAKLELGLTYLQINKIEKAKELAGQMEKLTKESPETSYLKGLIFYNERNIDDALVSLQQAVKKAPIPGAYYYMGLSYAEKGNLEQATSEFQKVIDMRKTMIQPRLMLAVTHLKRGRAEDAERETKKVLEMDEKNAFAHNILGSAYAALDKADLATEEFDRAIALNPGLVDAYIKKGAFNLLSGDAQKAEKEFISAVRIAPDLLNSRIMLAKYYVKNKKYQDAVNTLKEGLKGNTNDAILYNIIGIAYHEAKDDGNAKQNFEKAISSNPKFLLPYFNSALVDMNNGEKKSAIKKYNKVLDIDKNNVTALLMLAKIMESDKNDKEALSYYSRAKESGKVEAYLSLAGYYQRKRDTKQAAKELEEARSIDPKNVQAREMMGRLYMSEKNYNEALSLYKDLKDSAPALGTGRTASVYAAMGDYDKAIAELKGLLAKEPNRVDIMGGITNLYLRKKDFASAEKTAREIIALNPKKELSYMILALVYTESRQFKNAISSIKKAQEIKPDSTEIKVALGRTYMSNNDLPKALETFNEIEKATPQYLPVYFLQATVLEQMGNKNSAVEKYKKLLELSPNNAPALNNLAYLYVEGYGPVEKAVEFAKKAKEVMPKDGSITDTLGWTLYNKGNYDDAIKYFIEATYYLPADPTVRYHLALSYLKKGMEDKAEEQLKNSIRLGRQTPFSEQENAQKTLEAMKK
ncbi:MAG: PEP-CTERM system TPR-repeat protein PrsT [Nitrospirae bacterium]|nr:PEP-CTERM system TPR-repeat protein PrsT [Nitrospirota bacterium]